MEIKGEFVLPLPFVKDINQKENIITFGSGCLGN